MADPLKLASSAQLYFWPYDIFGYLLPGAMLIGGLAVGLPDLRNFLLDAASKGWFAIGVLTAAAYVAGHVVASASSLIFERLFLRGRIGWPSEHMFRDGNDPRILPMIFDKLGSGYVRRYSPGFKANLRTQFERLFGTGDYDHHDRFWLAWSYTALNHPPGFKRANHFLNLYGFARNNSFAFFILALAPMHPRWEMPWTGGCLVGFWWFTLGIIFSGFMFASYMKLLRRLNDEVYRSFYVCTTIAAIEHPADPQ